LPMYRDAPSKHLYVDTTATVPPSTLSIRQFI
jgi:hypothetical protein